LVEAVDPLAVMPIASSRGERAKVRDRCDSGEAAEEAAVTGDFGYQARKEFLDFG
jgi:hypothetical protein